MAAGDWIDPARFSGLTSDTAAASCWEIKQLNPSQPSGAYWLLTPAMTAPAQVWCDQETDGGGWVKVGQGRENWEASANGRGSASALLTAQPTADSGTHQLSTKLVDQILNGTTLTGLEDGVRVRRARSIDGTSWQEVRFAPTKSVGFFWSMGAKWPLTSWKVDSSTGSGGTTSTFGTGSSDRVVNTLDGSNHNFTWSFSYGNGVTGSSAASSYLWTPTDGQGAARPFSQVYLRPKLMNADLTFARVPDTGSAKLELEVLPDPNALTNPWGVTGIAGAYQREGDVEVQDMVAIGNTMYVGGLFQSVQRDAAGTGRVTQSFLAAFNATTGEFITGFRPTLNEAVLALAPTADGKLAVGGKFTTVNGVARAGFAILDPSTGALSGPQASLTNSSSPGVVRVETISSSGNDLYIGGSFTHTAGPTGATRYTRNVSRVTASTMMPVVGWQPEFNGTVLDSDVSENGSKAYFSGFFDLIGAQEASRAAALPTSLSPTPDTWTPTWSSTGNYYQRSIDQSGNRVYVGGSEHSMFSFDTSTYERMTTHVTDPKGDNQTLLVAGNFIFGGSHSNWFIYDGADQWPNIGSAWKRADPVSWINAWRVDGTRAVETFDPAITSRTGAGGWATAAAPNGTIWAGGDFTRARVQGGGGAWTGAFIRYGMTDGAAPNSPTNLRRTALTSTTATLAWNAPTGGVGTGGGYQIIRDDRVIATTTSTSITVPLGGEYRYFVRAVDRTGNVSASTTVLTVPGGNPVPTPSIQHSVAGLAVTFDASASTDNGSVAAYFWDFGDGTTSTEPVVTHSYTGGGSYQVKLTVVDDIGAWANTTYALDLVQPAPTDAYGALVFGDQPSAYWRLNETSGTTAADTATGQNRAVYQQGVTRGVEGVIDGDAAARFDGNDDVVVSSKSIAGPTTYSTEAWFKTTTTTGGKIIGFGTAASGLSDSYDRHVFMQNDGRLVFGVYSGVENRITSTQSLNDGAWHHVVATQSSDGMRLYVDGALAGSNPQTAAQSYSGYWRVGGDRPWSGASSNYFRGDIDEAAVYSVALTPTQVQAHYSTGANIVPPVVTDPYAQTVLADSPSAYWRLDSSRLGLVQDASPNAFNGAVVGNPSQRSDSGVSDGFGSMRFDGTDDGVAARQAVPGPSSFATEVWFNSTTTRGGKLAGFGNARTGASTNYDRHIYMLDSGQIVAGVYTGGSQIVTSPLSYNNGQWHHVVAQVSAGRLSLYIDGALVGNTDFTGSIQAYNGYWRLGGDTRWAGTSDYFAGDLDEFAVYSAPLTAARIAAHYSAGTAVANVPPVASFTSAVTSLNVDFDASASTDPDGGTIVSAVWDFGDNTAPAQGLVTSHAYAAAGPYEVTLTVTDNRGGIGTSTQTVTAQEPPNQMPVATFTTTSQDLTVSVDATGSTDPDGTITAYAWNFGDQATAAGVTSSHVYTAGGTYTVSLTVTDNRGGTTTFVQPVTVSEPANQLPTARIAVPSTAGLMVSVNGSTSSDPDGSVVNYAWDFGDGGSATGATATHAYATEGTRTITLTVTDNRGGVATATREVTVAAQASGEVVAESASWRYYYGQTAPAASWSSSSFNDATWSQGAAPIGYGSALVTTNLNPVATTADRPRAVYFRTGFDVADASKVATLELTGVADDGVVIYVNGVEVARQNMAAGTVTHASFALAPAPRTTAANAAPVVVQVPTNLLVNGRNVIAASTHVNYRGTPDLSFKLKATVTAAQAPVNSAPTAAIDATTSGLSVSVSGAASADPGGSITGYAWNFGDGSATATGATASHAYVAAGTYTVTLVVTDNLGATGTTTKSVTVGTPVVPPTTSEVVAEAAQWRYRYDAVAPAADWSTTAFDDATWSQGAAPIGYGSTLVTTSLAPAALAADRPRAVYFRTGFDVTDASKVTLLELTGVADDGVVIYVNGVEVARQNMAAGTVTHESFALAPPPRTTAANAAPVVVQVPTNLLVNGRNVIAASTHVNYRGTPDLSFKLKAVATIAQ